MKITYKQNGITLVALVITIIILLILAGISISALTNQGLFTQAQNAKNVTEEKTAEENEILTNYVEQMNTLIGGQSGSETEEPELDGVSASEATTHTATAITYSWYELSTIAQMISNNSSITNDTLEVNVKLNGVTNTLGVGDTATVDSQTVRILGFNHDTLTTETAYDGATTATGKAGISFEYVTFLTTAQMNSSNDNTGGWGTCTLRDTLNSTTYNGLSIKDEIKQVEKEFIQTYNDADSKTISSDYLWLLSCGEIWSSGYDEGVTRGNAIATEGSQYKYYKIGNPTYNSSTDYTKKPNTSSTANWWLRSPIYNSSSTFCYVNSNGICGNSNASSSRGVAPGFSI